MIGDVKSRHIGAAPQLADVQRVEAGEARSMLAIDELVEMSQADDQETATSPGFKAVRSFIRDRTRSRWPPGRSRPARADARRHHLESLAGHLQAEKDDLLAALALLESYAAIEIDGEAVRIDPKFFWEKSLMSLERVSFKKGREHKPRLSAPYVPGVHSEKYWTEEEDQILRDHYPGKGFAYCASKLPNRSKTAIYGRVQKLGVKRDGSTAAKKPQPRGVSPSSTPG